jgi:hypothetical protein|tara:strand:+ start:87 stop:626 length:540 start_codon:yes stop_codon:yes gene_type:complete
MRGPRRKNINYSPAGGQLRPYKMKTHEVFHMRGRLKLVGNEHELRECKECKQLLPTIAFTTKSLRSDGAWYLKKICRECSVTVEFEKREVKRKAPPQPETGQCDCCHKKGRLMCDHEHGTSTFRGWLCKSCNVGMGELGDDLEGILQAAIYLENDTNKIIEILHKVFNKMFSRTYTHDE